MIRLLAPAAAVGVITGLVAVTCHTEAVVVHAVGGVVALALVGVAARRAWNQTLKLLIGGMIAANLTGVVWTVYGAATAAVVAHVITGVAVSAGALIVAADGLSSTNSDTV